ncbi:hypothetical protein E2C01_099828 [Portunus trituberculatus]|uniref:Uncharacterized protein n=1 Tax=Portunus trituberculatus TaxID=210409 RepID=A0A5B7KHU0_PORTR|nr:hypothetical protein [Portunus trituberculatus]
MNCISYKLYPTIVCRSHPISPSSETQPEKPEPVEETGASPTDSERLGATAAGEAAAASVLECSGGLLIPLTWRCDGRKDCPLDGLDEVLA